MTPTSAQLVVSLKASAPTARRPDLRDVNTPSPKQTDANVEDPSPQGCWQRPPQRRPNIPQGRQSWGQCTTAHGGNKWGVNSRAARPRNLSSASTETSSSFGWAVPGDLQFVGGQIAVWCPECCHPSQDLQFVGGQIAVWCPECYHSSQEVAELRHRVSDLVTRVESIADRISARIDRKSNVQPRLEPKSKRGHLPAWELVGKWTDELGRKVLVGPASATSGKLVARFSRLNGEERIGPFVIRKESMGWRCGNGYLKPSRGGSEGSSEPAGPAGPPKPLRSESLIWVSVEGMQSVWVRPRRRAGPGPGCGTAAEAMAVAAAEQRRAPDGFEVKSLGTQTTVEVDADASKPSSALAVLWESFYQEPVPSEAQLRDSVLDELLK